MNKVMRGIWACPYLTEQEIKTCWQKAKVLATKQRVKGYAFWSVVTKIARGMAINYPTTKDGWVCPETNRTIG